MTTIDEALKYLDGLFRKDGPVETIISAYRSEKAKLEKVQLEMGKASKWLEEEITRREEVEARAGELEKELAKSREHYRDLERQVNSDAMKSETALEQSRLELERLRKIIGVVAPQYLANTPGE